MTIDFVELSLKIEGAPFDMPQMWGGKTKHHTFVISKTDDGDYSASAKSQGVTARMDWLGIFASLEDARRACDNYKKERMAA